jgi:hypothetical protein
MPQPLVTPPWCNQRKASLNYPTPLEIWATFPPWVGGFVGIFVGIWFLVY